MKEVCLTSRGPVSVRKKHVRKKAYNWESDEVIVVVLILSLSRCRLGDCLKFKIYVKKNRDNMLRFFTYKIYDLLMIGCYI